jgi:uncharacterized membrane protein
MRLKPPYSLIRLASRATFSLREKVLSKAKRMREREGEAFRIKRCVNTLIPYEQHSPKPHY